MLQNELRKIEARKKERDKKTQDLQKLITAADSQSETRKVERKIPRKKFPPQTRPRIDNLVNNFWELVILTFVYALRTLYRNIFVSTTVFIFSQVNLQVLNSPMLKAVGSRYVHKEWSSQQILARRKWKLLSSYYQYVFNYVCQQLKEFFVQKWIQCPLRRSANTSTNLEAICYCFMNWNLRCPTVSSNCRL